jgi:hypothetical protein
MCRLGRVVRVVQRQVEAVAYRGLNVTVAATD